MNKKELVKALSERLQITEVEALKFMDSFQGIVAHTLSQGGEITLIGFGKFHRKKLRARIGRNPQTGEPIAIPAKFLPAFSPSKTLKETIKQVA